MMAMVVRRIVLLKRNFIVLKKTNVLFLFFVLVKTGKLWVKVLLVFEVKFIRLGVKTRRNFKEIKYENVK